MMKYYLSTLSFILMMICNTQLSTSRVAHNNLTDMESLLAFKSGVSDPYNFLATNWTTDVTSVCNSWFGVKCGRRHPHRVVSLDLCNSSLYGTISPSLGNLSFLTYLHLGSNKFTGTIPASLGRLPRLAYINLNGSDLSGTIPNIIFNMSSLYVLSLAYNTLSGPLPNSDIHCNRLRFISLKNNSISGIIPSNFAKCPNLQHLSLSHNQLSGSIPSELGNLTGLQDLNLAGNELSGNIPTSIVNLTMLQSFIISGNNIQGSIPDKLGNLMFLQFLELDTNNLTGSIPASLLNASSLDTFQLSQNSLSGTVPTGLGKYWPKLICFHVNNNKLIGGLEFIASLSNSRNLERIQVGDNKFDDVLPNSIGNLSTSLSTLDMRHNYIKGELPSGIGNLTGLLYLLLEGNELTGDLPLLKMKALQGLDLRGNKIYGPIPFQLGLMTSLNYLDLSCNTLSGSIPYSLGNVSTLGSLNLASNMLSSNIPDTLWNLSGLLQLDLSNNSLHGVLSPNIRKLVSLYNIDLSKNHLSGNLPATLGELQMLSCLNLSSNSFEGQIPLFSKGLLSIEYLNLSYNSLSGTIPESFANMSYRTRSLDLSFNKLEGQIPKFSNLSVLSLEGNLALCGALELGFQPCNESSSSKSKHKHHLIEYILPPILCLALLACCYLKFLFLRERSRTPQSEAPVNEYRTIPYHDLVQATDNFSDHNLLGKGSFGSVFKAYTDDGSIFAVKVLNLEHEAALRSFDAECTVLSRVRHRNLVKIISACSNLDFKAVVLEFMPNGSLEQWLYSPNNFLNMLQRLNILVDVSSALKYLHHDHPEIILHRDVKPSNVLLDGNMIARVSDFGISKLLLEDNKSISSATTPGTFGYIAPEYGSTGKVSTKSDVYSFGILVLETITRKKPSDKTFNEGLSLRQWVSEAYPNSVQKIVDTNLLSDPTVNIDDECFSSIVDLGLQCSANSPKERMPMKDVVVLLQNIRMKYLSETSTYECLGGV